MRDEHYTLIFLWSHSILHQNGQIRYQIRPKKPKEAIDMVGSCRSLVYGDLDLWLRPT